jgi:diacylglycerol O-acyltransferase / wax synthase
MALVQLILSITDEKPDRSSQIETDIPQRELRPLARLLRPAVKAAMKIDQTWHATGDLFYQSLDFLTDASRIRDTARTGKAASLALGKLLFIGPDRKTILRGKCGISKKAVWSKICKVEEVKAIGSRMGGTINDILLSAMTGALRQYIEEHDKPVDGLNIRTIVPVNLRSPEDTELTGNWFGLVFLSLPVGVRDPIRRLIILKQRMDAIKESPEAIVAFGILSALGMSPQQLEDIVVSIFGLKASAVMTNVPGPTQPLFLAGRKIESVMFWVPTPADLGLGISILSYSGEVILGISSDEEIIPDPEQILNNFYNEMDKLSKWGLPDQSASR